MEPAKKYAAVAKKLGSEPGVETWSKKGFGSTGLSVGGSIFVMFVRGEYVAKLPKARVDELVASGQGRRFTLGKKTMKEWVVVGPDAKTSWLSVAREAREFVRG